MRRDPDPDLSRLKLRLGHHQPEETQHGSKGGKPKRPKPHWARPHRPQRREPGQVRHMITRAHPTSKSHVVFWRRSVFRSRLKPALEVAVKTTQSVIFGQSFKVIIDLIFTKKHRVGRRGYERTVANGYFCSWMNGVPPEVTCGR